MKLCKACYKMLPLESFSVAEARDQGRYYICKECDKDKRKKAKDAYARPLLP
jgi:RNase P subunit RPR2